MKHQILFCFLILFAISCDKDENVEEFVVDNITFEDQILGKWQVNSFMVNSCPNQSDNVDMVTSDDGCLNVWGSEYCMTIDIRADGKAEFITQYSDSLDPEVQLFSYQVNEAEQTFSICYDDFSEFCQIFRLENDCLLQEMDENGCICTFGFLQND